MLPAYRNLLQAALGRDRRRARVRGTRLTRDELLLLLLVVALALVLRVASLTQQPLWTDEFFSLATASGHSLEHPAAEADPNLGDFVEPPGPVPASRFADYLRPDEPRASAWRVLRATFLSDTSPPLYYLALAAWMRPFGAGDVSLRSFSLLASLVALLLLVAFARQVAGRAAVLPCAVLFALSPIGVHYSTEGRMYALLWLWIAATLLLAVRIRARGARLPLAAGFAAAAACGLLTHYFFAPVLLVTGAWLLAFPGRARRLPILASLAAAALLAAPWYAFLPASFGRWRVTGDWLRIEPGNYHPVLTPLAMSWRLLSVRFAWHGPFLVTALNALVLAAALAYAWRRLGCRLFSRRRLLPWLAAVAGLATPALLDLALHTYGSTQLRYALPALPAVVVVAALALAAVPPRPRAVAVLTLAALWGAGAFRAARMSSRSGQAYLALGKHLVQTARPDDLVVVHSIPSGVAGFARSAESFGTLHAPVLSWVHRLGSRHLPDDLVNAMAGRRRVLLVKVHTVWDPFPEEEWLDLHARRASSRRLEAIEVVEFVPRRGAVFARVGEPGGSGREAAPREASGRAPTW